MPPAIVTEGLTKYYGQTPGIVDLDLEVHTGEVFGFLGPNGAGKSTTIRLLLDLVRPTRGHARVLGGDSRRDSLAIRKRVGTLPAELALYPSMTARQFLAYLGALRDFDDPARVEALAERLDLDLGVHLGAASTGNRRKVGIVQAFMHEPELLILDEPTTGLDPLMQHEFFRLVDEVRAAGRTVFLSSHVLPEVERLADRVGIVRAGHLVAVETLDALIEQARRRVELVFTEPVDAALFAAEPGVVSSLATREGYGVELHVEGSMEAVMRRAGRHEIRTVVGRDVDLEDVFLRYYRDVGSA